MAYTIITDTDISQNVTYYNIACKLEDCSSSLHIRSLMNTLKIKINLYRINYLIRNKVNELLNNTTDSFIISMYNNLLEDLEDVNILFDYKVINNKLVRYKVPYIAGMHIDLYESRYRLLINLLSYNVNSYYIAILLSASQTAIIDNINLLIENNSVYNLDINKIRSLL